MQERINRFLNHQFPIFLWTEKGKFYYFIMTLIFVGFANVTQPFGIVNWVEYHRSLVLTCYIFLFFGMYSMLHYLLRSHIPRYFSTRIWTRKKEFRVFLFFFPAISGLSCLYAYFTVPGFKLTPNIFEDILLYNSTLSLMSVPTFGFYVDKKLNPARPIQLFIYTHPVVQKETIVTTKPFEVTPIIEPIKPTLDIEPTLPAEPKEKAKSKSQLIKEQDLSILQRLNEVMETEQLYLSKDCNIRFISKHIGIQAYLLSKIINCYTGKNIPSYVNEYRCRHAIQLFESENLSLHTIEAIGLKCGFKNRVSFHDAFKKIYHLSPSEYLSTLEN